LWKIVKIFNDIFLQVKLISRLLSLFYKAEKRRIRFNYSVKSTSRHFGRKISDIIRIAYASVPSL
jgi:hypothetical protein